MKKQLLSFLILLITATVLYGQGRTVSGTVTDEEGSALPGVTVTIKGTTTGTVTDIDGNYNLSVNDGDILVFSFVGFDSQEMAVGSRSVLDLAMSGATELSEVIIVGYGSQRQEDLTGAIQVVSAEKLAEVPAASFQDALQGNAPGLQVVAQDGAPGAGISIRVRGIGSINASNEPLYVVDGLPITAASADVTTTDFDNGGRSANPLAAINPNDIENIVILKDAASTAIYGSRGANGVILITTKQGKKGPAKVNLQANFGFSDFAFNNLLQPLNEAQYRQLYVEGRINSGSSATEAEALTAYNSQFPDLGDTNWFDEITQTGKTQQYDLSVQGGSDNITYFISGSYLSQEGTVVNNLFDRYSTRVNLTGKVSDKLTVSNNLNLSFSDQRGITDGTRWQAPFYLAYLMAPAVPVFDDQGRYYGDHASFFMGGNNPAGHLHDDRREREQTRIIDNLSASYEIMDGLTFKSAWSFDLLSVTDYIFANGRYGDGRNVGGTAQEATTSVDNWQGTQTLTYATTLNNSHNLDVLLGYEAQRVNTRQIDTGFEGFAHPELRLLSVGANPQANGFRSRTAYAFNSYFTRVNYDFEGKYFGSFSLRRDGSSRFGPNTRWGTFWSVGGGWTLSNESFMQGVSFIDNLKLRASYGVTGNANIPNSGNEDGNFRWASLWAFTPDYDGNPGAQPLTVGNPDLTWETQENLNVGLDFFGFNNRVNASVEYFKRISSDLLLNNPLSSTTGFTNIFSNVGDMENSGVELGISADVISNNDLVVTLGWNQTWIRNEITRLDEAILFGDFRREEGRDFQEFYLYGWAGVNPADGTPLFYTDETKSETTSDINEAVRFYDGKSATPDFFGSFNISASYKAFSLSTQFNYQFGNYVYDSPGWVIHGDGRFTPRSTSTWAFENRWTTPGQEALFPQHSWGNRSGSNTRNSSRYLFEGDFIRLRTVRLAYELPTSLISKANLSRVQVAVTANNMWTWVKDDNLHFDPEQTINGVYNTVTPIPKTWNFSLNIGL